ncbi:MAG: gliding motility-associated C-terminal domain-containing protein [Muribaculaceae bacterium]|nr:gliding motility-associated C-terminal domain-containing protein [Muribaculaceae bacterium]
MNKIILTIIAITATMTAYATSLTFIGNSKKVITEKPEASTGLDEIYVLYNLNGVTAQYKATSASTAVTWYRFSNLGGGYAEVVNNVVKQGNIYTLQQVEPDMGYIVEDGTTRHYYWVVDYSKHYLDIDDLNFAPEQECDVVTINPVGYGDAIKYYTINGQAKDLDRGITLSYNTLEYNADAELYNQIETSESFQYLPETMRAQAPLCDTQFTITGDRFLLAWGEGVTITSDLYKTNAVAAETTATQTLRENDNEKKDEAALGGSAPAEIEFNAVCSDAVIYKEWQFSTDADFENITFRMNEERFTHTFREQGTTYVRFMASNEAGTCDYYSATYEVFIGESSLDCPNAFSPDATEGINDEWKVSYKSIISFECHIFNRWGIKVAEMNDPSQGWDGKHNGKYVPAGVYYYVIKAEGADGRKYNLKGDINIIKYTYKGSSSTTTE